MMMIVICFYKETSERPAAFSMKTAVYIFSALLYPLLNRFPLMLIVDPVFVTQSLIKKIVFICSINVDNVRFINVCIIIILLLFFKYPRLYKSQWLKTKIKLKTEWPTGPDRRRQKYHATAQNWNIEAQQIHAETGKSFLSHQQKLFTIDDPAKQKVKRWNFWSTTITLKDKFSCCT